MESFETTAPIIVLVCSLIALLFSFIEFYSVKRKSEGTDMMKASASKYAKVLWHILNVNTKRSEYFLRLCFSF